MYLRASVSDRLALLAGLVDCDGCSSTRNDYRTTSPRLRDDVVELCRSLGGVPRWSQHQGYYTTPDGRKDCEVCYVINVRVPFNPFFLNRKRVTWKAPKERLNRWIESVDEVPDREMRCIKVEADDGLYVVDDYVVTHNTNARKPSKGELFLNIQFSTYLYALSRPEFWEQVVDGATWYERVKELPRRGIWFQLMDALEIDAGERDETDFAQLMRLCDSIEQAHEHKVFVPRIGEACELCAYTQPCGVYVPTPTEVHDQEGAWI
jgi:hypothetical protein